MVIHGLLVAPGMLTQHIPNQARARTGFGFAADFAMESQVRSQVAWHVPLRLPSHAALHRPLHAGGEFRR
jgi:hypothetical protein